MRYVSGLIHAVRISYGFIYCLVQINFLRNQERPGDCYYRVFYESANVSDTYNGYKQ